VLPVLFHLSKNGWQSRNSGAGRGSRGYLGGMAANSQAPPANEKLEISLPAGTKVVYSSTSLGHAIPAVVVRAHDDATYDLDVRQRAPLERISPLNQSHIAWAGNPGLCSRPHFSPLCITQ
jgi:hypothetical protein